MGIKMYEVKKKPLKAREGYALNWKTGHYIRRPPATWEGSRVLTLLEAREEQRNSR